MGDFVKQKQKQTIKYELFLSNAMKLAYDKEFKSFFF